MPTIRSLMIAIDSPHVLKVSVVYPESKLRG